MTEMSGTNSSLKFKVTRDVPELIPPAKPTPNESLQLSDLDSINTLRVQLSWIQFYKNCDNVGPYLSSLGPSKVIKDAIAKALVLYYPLAGRVRETREGKLVVECTGEGVLFVDARVGVSLDDFGRPLHPPFPCLDELLYHVSGSSGILHCPLLHIQVTRLKCGGFVIALKCNHTITDGRGVVQFLNAVAELAQGAEFPSVSPVWERHLLTTPNSSQVSRSFEQVEMKMDINKGIVPLEDMVYKSYFFGPTEISKLRNSIPQSQVATSFELITAHLWRCRAIAMYKDPHEAAQLTYPVDIRSKLNPPLPTGYYGNAVVLQMAESPVGSLSNKPLQYAVELVKESKGNIAREKTLSLADLAAISRGLEARKRDVFTVSDHRRLGLNSLDFGWGRPVYDGIAECGVVPSGEVFLTCYTPFEYLSGVGVVASICLPRLAMAVFAKIVVV
ncbi:hypothetical protein vseg_017442 [Gypsophila vaccaria]